MLSIQPTASKKCTPNLLPMRINHNGRIENTERYWTPTIDDKGTHHAYFRGRHLHGITLRLPSSHTGAVLNITDRIAPPVPTPHNPHDHRDPSDAHDSDPDDAEEQTTAEIKIAEQIGHFDAITVWAHGGEVDVQGDEFVRGVREWVGFAEGVHCDSDGDGDGEDGDGNSERAGDGMGMGKAGKVV